MRETPLDITAHLHLYNGMKSLNCPNCGNQLDVAFATAKMTTCDACDTALLLESGHVEQAGRKGDWHDAPALFKLGDDVLLQGSYYHITGHARFDYGTGWWDEYWGMVGQDEGVWISVDEGDIILQRALSFDDAPRIARPPELGRQFKVGRDSYVVTEADRATCIALRGSFPEALHVGETYDFVNCTGGMGQLLSGEFSSDGNQWFRGFWIDPFDVQAEQRA